MFFVLSNHVFCCFILHIANTLKIDPRGGAVCREKKAIAKQPRQQESSRFSRSSSARFARKLTFSSESEDLGCLAPRCAHIGGGGSEGGSTASSVPDFDFDTLEEKMNTTLSPLISFDKNSNTAPIFVEEEEPLTLFNQSPGKSSFKLRLPAGNLAPLDPEYPFPQLALNPVRGGLTQCLTNPL